MGRPTKVEGNPGHPVSRGTTDLFSQASILQLYDPDRSQVVTTGGRISTWGAFVRALREALGKASAGRGLRLLTGTISSPSLAAGIDALVAKYPGARWHQYEPVHRDQVRAGGRLAFGRDVTVLPHLDRAAVVLSIDADFLECTPECLRLAGDYGSRRRDGTRERSRLYAVESVFSLTGSMADHRLALRPSAIPGFVRDLAAALGLLEGEPDPRRAGFVRAVARDLQAHRGDGLVLAGRGQPPAVHALVHSVNRTLGNAGRTVEYIEPFEARPEDQVSSLASLVADMRAGKVDVLAVLGGNPVYDAPADLGFADACSRVPFRVRHGLHEDETSAACHWHVPAAHPLEAWGDVRAVDGTLSIRQPLIAPLYFARSEHEMVAVLTGDHDSDGHELVRRWWRQQRPGPGFAAFWSRTLRAGVVDDSTRAGLDVEAHGDPAALARALPSGSDDGLELVLRPDASVWDGRFANHGWLQELPDPLTRLTWGNAALVGPALAERLAVGNGDVVELRIGERSLNVPIWVHPGTADGCVALALGYGRTRAGTLGTRVGADAYRLRTTAAPWTATGLRVRPTRKHIELASVQLHHDMDGRDLLHVAAVGQEHGTDERAGGEERGSLYPPQERSSPQWGMSIDLDACTGCSACVVACQSENNIPVVGREQVLAQREMQWIRIDRYFAGAPDDPSAYHQPVPCMHCEYAPCEVVCPVGATVHSDEGLNEMVYNRCVGTRYCSNNCPYKVRRFNFLQYADERTPVLAEQRNPDVTVRERGVMEKCTYCVQRISEARIHAKEEGRPLRDGDVVPACQQACPTRAIVFGDITDPTSAVARAKADRRDYAMLADLNTRPRTTYRTRLRNPNPELEDA